MSIHLNDISTEAIQGLTVPGLLEVHRRLHQAALTEQLPPAVMPEAALANLLLRQEMVLREIPLPPSVRCLDLESAEIARRSKVPGKLLRRLALLDHNPIAEHPEYEDALDKINVSFLPVERRVPLNYTPETQPAEERICFGKVWVPEQIDTYQTWASAELIRRCAHLWLARFQNSTHNHDTDINRHVEIYESYIAPVDMVIEGNAIKKGTWLLMTHILDDDIWAAVQRGEITGFSIGGFSDFAWGSEPPESSE